MEDKYLYEDTLTNVKVIVVVGMIEHGLAECTSYGIHRHISPTLAKTKVGSESDAEEFLEVR